MTLVTSPFEVHLDVFEGPFDLLLGLIAKSQLDLTEVALSQVTDEFIAHIRAAGPGWELGQATEFLVVAATLLDLKAARLLPGDPVEDEEDLALLEARDLLFARLLQYRAYKQAAAHLADLFARQATRFPRTAQLEPRFADLLPEVVLGLGAAQFAALAARALTPRPAPVVAVDHVHGGTVSVREQTALLVERLRREGSGTFRSLTADCDGTLQVVARFLGLLDLFREGVVAFDQQEPLGELQVRWTGPDEPDGHGLSAVTGLDDRPAPPLPAIVEAVLLVSDEPLSAVVLAQVVERPTQEVEGVLRSLAEDYRAAGRGVVLREVAGGWRLYTRDDCAPWVERFVLDGQSARLTQAALETLAIIAYRQPVTRARVSAVRGVSVDGVVRTLVARGLVVEAGTDPDSSATLYRTTDLLLERLGLSSLDELPPLAPFLPDLGDLDDEAPA